MLQNNKSIKKQEKPYCDIKYQYDRSVVISASSLKDMDDQCLYTSCMNKY